ncbi:hypothetical protein ACKKBH_12440 [Aeromonas dhakensis]|uniref:hypothetical protein n=1 Tax=Aeromonas dhakensis TaxID=196024 RepID=UPI0038F7F456
MLLMRLRFQQQASETQMAAIASYLPESQIITLSDSFPAFDNPDALNGFNTPVQLGFFFHEWIHFLHNVSTYHGLSSFSLQVVLWSNFRWTMNEMGVSIGSETMDPEHILQNKNFIQYLYSNRKRNFNDLPTQAQPDELSFTKAELIEHIEADANVVNTSLIKCGFQHKGNTYTANIGTLEIIESVAFMLESKLVSNMNGVPEMAPICPYHLVECLSRGIAPSLDEINIICCMLISLQSNDPPQLLLMLLKDIESLIESDRHDALISYAKNHLISLSDIIDSQLNQIRSIFPIDEPMGVFIRSTLDRIESNIDYRKQDPFFELSIIDEISKDPKNFDSLISRYGGCSVIQKRLGADDQVLRDVMYDIIVPDHDDTKSLGWKMAHASFKFVMSHFNLLGEIRQTESLNYKCPFYTVCNSSLRITHSNICAVSPWQSRHLENNHDCYYSGAIKATSPPPEVQI